MPLLYPHIRDVSLQVDVPHYKARINFAVQHYKQERKVE